MGRRLTTEEAMERFALAAFSTASTNRPRTEKAIRTLYRAAGLEAPAVVWGRSPRETCLTADETVGPIRCDTLPGDRLVANRRPRAIEGEISHILLPWLSPSLDIRGRPEGPDATESAYPGSLWRVVGFGHGLHVHPSRISTFPWWDRATVADQWALLRFAENVGWWRLHETVAFVSQRPNSVSLDHLNRPHSTVGPAITFRDGWSLYAVDGIRVPAWTVEHPDRITSAEVDAVNNAELRRVLVTLAGDRHIVDRGTLVHADDWGELWSVPNVDSRFLRVVDATERPDGTRKRYWLRVPDEMETAHQAVAWTFDLTPDSYAPVVET